MTYGYARVSSRDQNEARQLDALHAAGVVNAYIDRQARKTGACLHCPWHTTGAACVLPRCFKPRGKEDK